MQHLGTFEGEQLSRSHGWQEHNGAVRDGFALIAVALAVFAILAVSANLVVLP